MGSSAALQEIISDVPMVDLERRPLRKPSFMFGDSVANPQILAMGESRWLRTIEGRRIFTPPMLRDLALSELQVVAVPRKMNWDLTPCRDGVTCGYFGGVSGVGVDKGGHGVTGVLPGSLLREMPANESATRAGTFRNRFF